MTALSERVWDASAVLSVLAADYGLKTFASHAGARGLAWLLAPTAALVSHATGHAFVAEAGAGYVSRELFVVIAPVCSGVNFMIIAFTALACGFFTSFVTPAHKYAWLAACAAFAYCLTIGANSLRILAALAVGRCDWHGLLSPASAHRALGIAVYLACLLGSVALAKRLVRRLDRTPRVAERFSLVWVPLASYVAVTVVTPLLRGASSRAFFEHAIMIMGAAGFAMLVLWLSAKLAAHTERRLGRLGSAPERRGASRVVDVARRSGQSPLSG